MADTKITALTALTAADPANDVIPIVDVSDTTMAASGTTKKISVNNILGASGTATLASATITGAATVGTTLGVTGASTLTGNVAVGTTSSPWSSTFKAVNVSTYAAFGGNNDDKLTLIANNFYNDGTGKFIGNGYASTYDQYQGTHRWQVSTTSNASGAGAAATLTRVMTADVSGNLLIGVTSANANGGVLQLKSGITFPATQVAASDANTLDDYEEGTWTGTLKGSSTDPTVALTATGQYTKIGRLVTIRISFSGSTVGAVGGVSITGVPFASTNDTPGSLMASNALTFTGIPVSYISGAATTINLYQTTSAGVLTSVNHSAGLSREIWVSLTYYV